MFSIELSATMPYEINNNFWKAIQIVMSPNFTSKERVTYSTFDFLSDIGGLSGMLYSIFAVFMQLWNYNCPDNFMVTKLYTVKNSKGEEKAINYTMVRNCKELILS